MIDMSEPTNPHLTVASFGNQAAEHAASSPRDGAPAAGVDDAADMAATIASVREAVRHVPEVRAERVAALRRRVAAGTYRVPDAVLARALRTYQG